LVINTKIFNLCDSTELAKSACSHNIHLGTHALV
jgi:hypothetical protein